MVETDALVGVVGESAVVIRPDRYVAVVSVDVEQFGSATDRLLSVLS